MSALNELKSVVLWITEKSNGLTLQGDRRARLAYGCLDLAIEHMAGISVLAEQPFWGPVYALIRPEFDALIRGMWLGLCATEDQLDRFTNDTLFKGKGQISIIDMVTQVEARAGYSKGILTKLRESSWSIMSDFTHTGFKHVWRRNSETHTGPNYPADETEQVLRLAASLGLLAATAMADMSGNKDVAAAGLARAKEFAATSPTKRDDNHTEGTPQETPHGN